MVLSLLLESVARAHVAGVVALAFQLFVGSASVALLSFTFVREAQTQELPIVSSVEAVDLLKSEEAFRAFLAGLPLVVVDGPRRQNYYLMEGDLLQTEEQVRGLLRAKIADKGKPDGPKGELKVLTRSSVPVIWQKKDRNLTYSVDRKTFPVESHYDAVVTNLRLAADAWMDACPACGLSFVHQVDHDKNPNIKDLTFVVRFKPNEAQFIAAAFFPYEEEDRRVLWIAPSYFSSPFNKVGVLRHELGHILGYRHEHIEGIAGCGREGTNWKKLSQYDPKSVMHYFCGSGGTRELQLSDLDKVSHAELYK